MFAFESMAVALVVSNDDDDDGDDSELLCFRFAAIDCVDDDDGRRIW